MRYKELKNWEDTMTHDEVDWCWSQIRRILREDFPTEHCVDNFRAARVWKSSQMRRFRKQEAHGCCGSYNEIVIRNYLFKKPDIYIVGFNYGH